MRQHIPNILTLSNLFCGLLAIPAVLQGQWLALVLLTGTSLLADFLDGFVARQLGISTPIGQQLDSLADLISFGVVPGLVLAYLAGLRLGTEAVLLPTSNPAQELPAILAALLIPVFSAVRLAKFNLDTRQSDRFIGVPTPANAMLVVSLWVITQRDPNHWLSHGLANSWVLLGLSLLLSFLLVAPLPLLALKFKDFSWTHNRPRYLLLGSSLLLLLWLQELAVPLIFALYLGLSVWENVSQKVK